MERENFKIYLLLTKQGFENETRRPWNRKSRATRHNGCHKIRPQEDSAQRRPTIFEMIRPLGREDSVQLILLSFYPCISLMCLYLLNDMVIFIFCRIT